MMQSNSTCKHDNSCFLNNAAYEALLNQISDIVLLTRLDGSICYANQAAADAYQYSQAGMAELSLQHLCTPTSATYLQHHLAETNATAKTIHVTHLRSDRSCFLAEIKTSFFPLLEKPYYLHIVQDLSQCKEIDQSLTSITAENQTLQNDLSAAYEELLASEEELRQQLDELLTRDYTIQQQQLLLQALQKSMFQVLHHLQEEDILQHILQAAAALVQTEHGFIHKTDATAQVHFQAHGLGVHACCIGLSFPWHEGLAGELMRQRRTIVENDYTSYQTRKAPPTALHARFNKHHLSYPDMHAVVLTPLWDKEEIVGIIGLSRYADEGNFTPAEAEALEQFASMASLALNSSKLFHSLKKENLVRRKTEQHLLKSQHENQALLSAIPDTIFVLNKEGRFLQYKTSAIPLAAPPEEFLGKKISDIFPSPLSQKTMRFLQHSLVTQQLQTFEYEWDSQHYEARLVPNGQNEVITIIRDITERYDWERKLRFQSLHDSLTGLYNRTSFEERMQQVSQTLQPAGLLICDVDGLKLLNDTFGHATGDQALRHVAGVLQDCFPADTFLARIGGDEFAAVFNRPTPGLFSSICTKIRAALEEHNQAQKGFPVSLSLGYAISSQNPPDMNSLFKEADTNMYREKLLQKQSAKNAIVQTLERALEARDYLTEGHGKRLHDLMEQFIEFLGLPASQLADLRLLAHFHDIGKVGIPDHILFKPGPLTKEEWAVMKQHTEIGYRMAKSIPDFEPIADWIISHHERWDGQGYPQGLKKTTIPLPCRILALVDAYDAMTHDRPYRKAASASEAVAELQRCSGSQFDPELTTQFIKLLESDNLF